MTILTLPVDKPFEWRRTKMRCIYRIGKCLTSKTMIPLFNFIYIFMSIVTVIAMTSVAVFFLVCYIHFEQFYMPANAFSANWLFITFQSVMVWTSSTLEVHLVESIIQFDSHSYRYNGIPCVLKWHFKIKWTAKEYMSLKPFFGHSIYVRYLNEIDENMAYQNVITLKN